MSGRVWIDVDGSTLIGWTILLYKEEGQSMEWDRNGGQDPARLTQQMYSYLAVLNLWLFLDIYACIFLNWLRFILLQPCRHAPTVSAASFLSNAVCSADLSLAPFSTLFEIKYFNPLTLPVMALILLVFFHVYLLNTSWQPHLQAITFHKCKNLKVQNLRVVNSQQMHIAFTNCLRVVISNLKVIAPAESPNTDGIHISASRGVEVKNSIVGTG